MTIEEMRALPEYPHYTWIGRCRYYRDGNHVYEHYPYMARCALYRLDTGEAVIHSAKSYRASGARGDA